MTARPGPRPSPPPPLRRALVIARWRFLEARRALADRLLRTWPGRLTLLVLLLALPGFVRSWPPTDLARVPTDSAADPLGVWALGVASGAVCVAFLVPAVLSRVLVLDAVSDPLRTRPSLLPTGAGVTGAVVAWSTATYAFAFFLLFHGHFLVSTIPSGVALLAGATGLGTMIGVAAVSVAVSRAFLRGSDPRRRAERLRRTCALPFFLSFTGLAWLPGFAARWPMGQALALTEAFNPNMLFSNTELRTPFLAAAAAVSLTPLLVLRSWSSKPAEELGLVASEGICSKGPEPIRIPLVGAGLLAETRLMCAKDESAASRFDGVALAAAATAASLTALVLGAPFPMVALAATAVAAFPGLTWMGHERRHVASLAICLGVDRLYGVRSVLLLRNSTVLAATVLGCFIPLGIVFRLDIPIARTLAAGTLGCAMFSVIATAIGAILPGRQARPGSIAGASRSGIAIYVLMASAALALSGPGPTSSRPELAVALTATASMAFLGRAALRGQVARWRP